MKRHLSKKYRVFKKILGTIDENDIVRLKKNWSFGFHTLEKGDRLLVLSRKIWDKETFCYCLRYRYCYPIEKKYLEVIGWVSK